MRRSLSDHRPREQEPRSRLIARGEGWMITEYICTAGPGDRPFEEKHEGVSIAAVIAGTFSYRSTAGHAFLHPGAVLFGRHGHCFECRHDHSTGDRCIAFNFAPDFFEEIATDLTGSAYRSLPVALVAPHASLVRLQSFARALANRPPSSINTETAIHAAESALLMTHGNARTILRTTKRDHQRVTDVLRHIELCLHEPLSLEALARLAGMSKYHFLRVFRHITGHTPQQFILAQRMSRAATDLALQTKNITATILGNGFNDISTFNARFRRIFGEAPGRYRARASRVAVGDPFHAEAGVQPGAWRTGQKRRDRQC